MRNTNYALKWPFASAIGITLIGALFVIQHYAYAHVIISIGFLSLALLAPFNIWQLHTMGRKLAIPLKIATSVLIIGTFFKLSHWPLSGTLIVSSTLVIAVLYLIHYVKKSPKVLKDHVKAVLIPSSLLAFMFTAQHYMFSNLFRVIATVAFISWLGLALRDRWMR